MTTTDARRPLFVARLAGTQEEMGAQHGALTAADARRLLEFYRTMPERTLAGGLSGASRFVVRQIASAWQARLAHERPRELAARGRAFIEAALAGTRIDRRGAARTFAVMDAMQNCVALAARARLGPFARASAVVAGAAVPACSTAIAWGGATADGELLFARNFDFPGVGVWDVAPSLVTCTPDRGQRYAFFTTRGADAPVVTVVNEAGLVMAPHTRWHRGVTWGGAMIVDIVHEIARAAETLQDAVAIARSRPASSSWGLAIGSAREKSALVIEFAGTRVETVRPHAGADYLVCANRYRDDAMRAGQLAASTAWAHHSDHRERRLRALVEARPGLTPRDLAGFLGDRDHAGAHRHLGSILSQPTNVHAVVVAPSQPQAWVGVDRAPCNEGTWAHVAWTWDGPAGGWELAGPRDERGGPAPTREERGGPAPAATLRDVRSGATDASSGFSVRELAGFVRPHDRATVHVREAVHRFEHDHDIPAARAAIEHAVAAAPDDPSLRLAAAWLALETGDPGDAATHVRAGLAHETEPYRRAQLLACGVRTAHAEVAWVDELARITGEGADEQRAFARRRSCVRTNLVLQDAL